MGTNDERKIGGAEESDGQDARDGQRMETKGSWSWLEEVAQIVNDTLALRDILHGCRLSV